MFSDGARFGIRVQVQRSDWSDLFIHSQKNPNVELHQNFASCEISRSVWAR